MNLLLDFDKIATAAEELGFAYKRTDASLRVTLEETVHLDFVNDFEENNNAIGFSDTAWHFHDKLTIMGGDGCYQDLPPDEVLLCVATGELLLAEQWIYGKLTRRWLHYGSTPFSTTYFNEGEECRVRRIWNPTSKPQPA